MLNTNAIDKIIKTLSLRDYHAARAKLTKAQKYKIMNGKMFFSYTLSADTVEAIATKKDYLCKIIDEETYKAYCLKANLKLLSS